MNWLAIGLAFLKLVNLILGWVREEQWKEAGRREAVAAGLAEAARKAGVSRDVLAEMSRLDDAGVDAVLRGLEPDR